MMILALGENNPRNGMTETGMGFHLGAVWEKPFDFMRPWLL